MATIYDVAGVADPTAGLRQAVGRANAAVVRMRAAVPHQVPGVPRVVRPNADTPIEGGSARVRYDGYSDQYDVCGLRPGGGWVSGAVASYIAAGTPPGVLLVVTRRAEQLAGECERMAADHEAAIARATAEAVATARADLDALAAYALAARVVELEKRVGELESTAGGD